MSQAHAIRDKLKGLAFNYMLESTATCYSDSVSRARTQASRHKLVVLESVALDHLSGYESRILTTLQVAAIASLNPMITPFVQSYDVLAACCTSSPPSIYYAAHPSVSFTFFFLNNALYTLYGFSSQKRKEVPASKLSTM
jgi:hypothetical protein